MDLKFLSADQAGELKEKLADILSGDELDDAIASIDLACYVGAKRDPAWKQKRKQRRGQLLEVAKRAEALSMALDAATPSVGLGDANMSDFRETCRRVAESARIESGDTPRPCRPAEEWRDNLIATVRHFCPVGQADPAFGSHFHDTVALVLGYLENYPDNLRVLLVNAARRQPDPGMVVRKHRPVDLPEMGTPASDVPGKVRAQ